MTFLTIVNIALLILNLLFGYLNHLHGNYKTSAFNFFAAGVVFANILNAII